MKPIFVITSLVTLSISGCKKPEIIEPKQEAVIVVAPSLPLQRTITGKDGRKLAVTIVERSATHINIVRDSDQKSFNLAIAELSAEDQNFVNEFPISDFSVKPAKKTVKSADEKRLENRYKELEKLNEKASDYVSELNTGNLNSSQSSAIKGKLGRLEQEIQKLEQNIRKLEGGVRSSGSSSYEKKGSSGRP